MMGEKVQILLATYNGEKYIKPQIDSVLNQDYHNLCILIRDDGSVDGTKMILEEYKDNEKVIDIIYGNNIGVINNFFELLKKSDPSCAYFAFCDQDDVWLEPKISKAIELLSMFSSNEVNLYCSNKTLVDQNLNRIGRIKNHTIRPSFYNALVENIATGCTIVINKTMRNALLEKLPDKIVMHDWWMYIFASVMGNVIYDDRSYILYRQHESNIIGAGTNSLSKWRRRIINFKKNQGNLNFKNQALEVQKHLNNCMCANEKLTIVEFLFKHPSLLSRIKYALKTPIYRQSTFDNVLLKLLVIINRI